MKTQTKRVQSMLGHSHGAMTEHYLGLNLERFRRNRAISGKAMFPTLQNAQIIPIRREL